MSTFRLGSFEFSIALAPTIATALVIALTIFLGRWQLNRAEEKQMLRHQYEAVRREAVLTLSGQEPKNIQHLQFRQLAAEGEFEATKQIFLDNQVKAGRVGYYVLTPLRLLDNERYVLVNRGWVARGPEYPAPPMIAVPAGRVRVQGYGALPVKRFLELSPDTIQGEVWQNVTFERYEDMMGLDLLPIMLVQTVGNSNGLSAVEQSPDFGIAKHQGYAFQWFALSAALLVTYVVVNTRQVKG